ncbi:MAG: Type secretion system protein [Verrucomicrobiota bacterium]|jgi:prepilin-type N-terminal cleavage/methylation domain-containing protein
MFIERARAARAKGFTLLEIMIAVTILAGMSIAIYRFVQANVMAMRVSSDVGMSDTRYDALRDTLTFQWQSLPSGLGALNGEAIKVNDLSRDRITWTCGAGPGLLTRYAGGDYLVSLQLRPAEKKTDQLDLGVLRKPVQDQSFSNVHESWVPLIENVQTLQIRYFDPRLNVWQDRWTDNVTLPRLVKLTIGRSDSAVPWEAIIPLGRTPL